ncbi:MAG: anhydro-N-acetylmuramic acid kinase [Clostridia bacterium]|nr:anhydro-N-acetylmuramic acid kinase [Clostridia bacterium]
MEVGKKKYAIGLMSGTSVDGIDAALVEISGCGENTRAKLAASMEMPYSQEMRAELIRLASGDKTCVRDICLMNALIGRQHAAACLALCVKSGVPTSSIAFVGMHGHTFWHIPQEESYLGEKIASTLQLGDASPVNEALGCPVVSDFRVRDMAAGGQGAPLVPYADYILFRDEERNVALQNIGGIANVTFLPAGCKAEDVIGFDTGPGNMVMDTLAARIDPLLRYDPDGSMADKGRTDQKLLGLLLEDVYYSQLPPKSTGREKYGAEFTESLLVYGREHALSLYDMLSTAADLTCETIALAYERFAPVYPDRVIVSGGGAANKGLMRRLKARLKKCELLTPEALGWSGDMKEAVAFAVLANECLNGHVNTLPSATGAKHAVVMGKISV